MFEVGYYRPHVFFVPVLILLVVLVVGLVLFTFLNRYLYDRRISRLEDERLRVESIFRGLETNRDPSAAKRTLGETLDRASGPNRVFLVTLVNGMDEPERSVYLDYVMRHEGRRALAGQARHSPSKWKRIEAIEILGWLEHPEVLDTLALCLEDGDEDIVYAAMRTLAARSEPYAAELLLRLLGKDRVNPKTLVAKLEEFSAPIEGLVRQRLKSRNPETRACAATILETSRDPKAVTWLIKAAGDTEDAVRSAAIKSLANIGDPRAKEVLPEAFGDEVWFVRAGAARLAGALKATEFSDRVIRLLQDGNWWVRQNAKIALIALCPEVEEKLGHYLMVEDRFVRNMVVEVLDASGAIERKATELEEDPDSEEGRKFFERLIAAEGGNSIEGLAERARPELGEVLRELLDGSGHAARSS